MIENRSAAPGPVVPVLVYEDVGKAIEWLCETFGFVERFRYGPEGKPKGAQLAVGGGSIFLTAERVSQSSKWADSAVFRAPRPGKVTHTVMVNVADVDSHFSRVKQRGAHIFSQPETHPFGERQYTVEDPGGHRWTFSQSVADAAPEDWGGKSVHL